MVGREFRVMLLPGDGIGPEIIAEAVKVLEAVGRKWDCSFSYDEALVGGASIDAIGRPITDDVLARAQAADAVLLGAVGGPKWDGVDPSIRPEKALFALRKGLGLFANIRPVAPRPALLAASTLRPDVLQGVDLVVVRELTGGLYFGEPRYRKALDDGDELAVDTLTYTAKEIRRIAEKAFEMAGTRRGKVTSVDKANVLESSRLWRQTVGEVAKAYPHIELEHMLVDNCAMQLVRNPRQFDVIVTENLFGDILSDEAAMLTGSIGMLPSSSLGAGRSAMYEPIHGSAPDIAGQGKANPIATILSAAMMLGYSFGMEDAAAAVERAVDEVLAKGYRTGDLMEEGATLVGTSGMGDLIVGAL